MTLHFFVRGFLMRFSMLLLLGTVQIAFADKPIGSSDLPAEIPPRKQLYASLLAECDKAFAARKAEIDKLKTADDVAARRTMMRAKFIDALGGFPQKTPLNAKTVGVLKRDGYRIEKVIFESRPDHHVTANLYLPDGPGPFPGVLMPIGHSLNGKAAEYMQRGAVILAKNGISALPYDPIGQGERSQLLDNLGKPAIKGSTSEHTMCGAGGIPVGRGTASYRIWDGIRALDYLASRPEIDAQHLGCSGCSGGGTLTSYLMSLDDRILAAAPSCYITTLDRLFNTIGPQDGEQNITGQVAFGLDHPEFLLMRAPKPTLLLAATRDFFDIQGTWTTFREAKRVYTSLGHPECVDIIESDGPHGYPREHREAMARFMCRFLKGKDQAITEQDFPLEKDADLYCTRSGQVLEDLKGKSVFDLNALAAAELAKTRATNTRTPEEFRQVVRRVIGSGAAVKYQQWKTISRESREGYSVESGSARSGDGFPVAFQIFTPAKTDKTTPTVIYAHELGKVANTEKGGAVETLVRQDKRVVTVDLRGYGETAPAVAVAGKAPAFGVEQKESFVSLHLNRPLLGRRVDDLLGLVNQLADLGTIEVIGVGSAGPIALHAAVLDERIKTVTLVGSVPSWELIVRTPISNNQLATVVPGALREYDLPNLAAAVAPRPLTINEPVDPVGNLLASAMAEKEYAQALAAYQKAKARENFKLTTATKALKK